MAQFGSVFDDNGQVTGLVHDIQRSAVESRSLAANVVASHAGNVVDRWRNSVPVETGKLRDSISVDFEYDDDDPVGIAYSDWFVARLREYGTATQPPHSEAQAALEAEMDAFRRSIADLPRL